MSDFLAAAVAGVGRAIAVAQQQGLRVAVVVVDRTGTPVALQRIDRAYPSTVEVARAKANTAFNFGAPTATLAERILPENRSALQAVVPHLMFVAGASHSRSTVNSSAPSASAVPRQTRIGSVRREPRRPSQPHWVVEPAMPVDHASALRDRIAVAGPPVVCPGVADGLAARLAAELGFSGIYVSGAGSSAARGLPDMGLMTSTELVDAVRVLVNSAGLPAVVDGDTGYGDSAGIRRTVLDIAAAGAAAVHIEDQPFPRRCGYLTSDPCAPVAEMLRRLDAAREADSGLVLIARTDALLTEGLERAVERSTEYAKAGVDLLMVNGVRSYADLRRVHEATGFPMVHNVSGSDRTPAFTAEKYRRVDVRVVIYPIQAARAAAEAAKRYLISLRGNHDGPDLMPFPEYMALAGWREAAEFEDRIARPRPDGGGAE